MPFHFCFVSRNCSLHAKNISRYLDTSLQRVVKYISKLDMVSVIRKYVGFTILPQTVHSRTNFQLESTKSYLLAQFYFLNGHFYILSSLEKTSPRLFNFSKIHTRTFILQPPCLLFVSQEEIFPTRPRIVWRK